MPATLNIQNIDTIKYRTDCFASYSDVKKHYIRNHNATYNSLKVYNDGYQQSISNVQGQTKKYDIGYNPYSTNPANPLVCDKLLLLGSYKNKTNISQNINDLCYERIKFHSPLLVFNHLYDDSTSSTIRFVSRSGGEVGYHSKDYALFDEIYASGSYLFGSGQYWNEETNRFVTLTNSIVGEFNVGQITGDFSDRAGNTDISIEFPEYFTDYNLSWLEKQGIKGYVCTKSELISRFTYTGIRPKGYDILLDYDYGALMLPERSLTVQSYTANKCNKGFLKTSMFSPYYYNLFQLLIIPFISQAEYEAAKASIYTWENNIISAINNVL